MSSSGGYAADFLFITASTAGGNTADWTSSGLRPGVYRVSATWVTGTPARVTNAQYRAYDGDATTGTLLETASLNQQNPPNDRTDVGLGWEDIGVFSVGGTTLTVRLTDQASPAENGRAAGGESLQHARLVADVQLGRLRRRLPVHHGQHRRRQHGRLDVKRPAAGRLPRLGNLGDGNTGPGHQRPVPCLRRRRDDRHPARDRIAQPAEPP